MNTTKLILAGTLATCLVTTALIAQNAAPGGMGGAPAMGGFGGFGGGAPAGGAPAGGMPQMGGFGGFGGGFGGGMPPMGGAPGADGAPAGGMPPMGGFGGFGGGQGGMPPMGGFGGGQGGFPMMGGFGGGFPGMGGAPGGQQQEVKPDKGSQLPKGYNSDGPTYAKVELCSPDKKCPVCSLWDAAKKEWKDIEPLKKNGSGRSMFGMFGMGGGNGVMQHNGQPIGAKQIADIKYLADASNAQYMDAYFPEIKEGQKVPAILFIHGGAWWMGSARGNNTYLTDQLVKAGYAVFALNYRLTNEALFPRQINDAKAAVRWIRAHAKEHGIDADHIGTIGDSSGGHMAGMLGTTSNLKGLLMGDIADNAEYSSSVQAVVDLFGPMNGLTAEQQGKDEAPVAGRLQMGYDGEGSFYSTFVGVTIRTARETDPTPVQLADPGMYAHTLDPKTAPGFLIQHGTVDTTVPLGSSREFAETVTKYIGKDKVSFEIFEGATHENERFFEEKNCKHIIELFDKYLKPKK